MTKKNEKSSGVRSTRFLFFSESIAEKEEARARTYLKLSTGTRKCEYAGTCKRRVTYHVKSTKHKTLRGLAQSAR